MISWKGKWQKRKVNVFSFVHGFNWLNTRKLSGNKNQSEYFNVILKDKLNYIFLKTTPESRGGLTKHKSST
jgi:hypothetical protein